IAVLWTVFSTKEYSPEELKKFSQQEEKSSGSGKNKIPKKPVSAKRFYRTGWGRRRHQWRRYHLQR
ncbi:MAG: hypothetical protein ACK2UP_01330, partial [Candidatus Promineifilaceae bacterium]